MRFWTVAWIAFDDRRLACAYFFGVFLIMNYFVWAVVVQHAYLEYEAVQGVCRPHLARPLKAVQNLSYCPEIPCRRIPSAEVEAGVTVGRAFVATRVREVLTRCGDEFCMDLTERVRVNEFFVAGVEDYVMTPTCSAQSFRFFSEACVQHELVEQASSLGQVQGKGLAENDKGCPFTTSNLHAKGQLLGPGGHVLRDIPEGTEDTFTLRTWLEAAGVFLEQPSDASDAKAGATFRQRGVVLVVTIAYHNVPGIESFWDTFRLPGRSAIRYDIKVQRVSEADYHVHQSIVHESARGVSLSESRTSHGILVRFAQTGRLGRFSWAALADQIVLKIGVLAILQLTLDFFWRYVLPLFGTDYNSQVYSWVVKPTAVAPTKDV
eukprot:TRINITY_DN16689_c0_g3_i1.p1 TRINITY_DN16689_c0_g3~~TRINITY_DN16689_c0_g3_i1.p1  ORF type:complete len:378 (+),score=40.58 TRINITY_DN16689_c0_g3_i1:136-1269(+)